MSRENMEVVHSIYAAWERGDYSFNDWAHPEIQFVLADGPSPGTRRGLTGMTEGWRDFLSVWEEFSSVVEGYRELDDERVLVLHHWGGRGKTSGLEVTQMTAKAATVFHIRDGKVTRLVIYFDRERAFAALGLASDARVRE